VKKTHVPFGDQSERFLGEWCSIIGCISMSDDLKFKHPFLCIVSGPSRSGKTSFCERFLQNLDALCTEREFDGQAIARRELFPRRQNCRRGTYILTTASRKILKTLAADRAS